MAIMHILVLRIREFFGSGRIIFAVFLLPLFFVYLIGSVYSEDNPNTKNINIFVDEDQTLVSQQLIALLEEDPLSVVIIMNREEAFGQLAAMRAQNVFIIPGGFAATIDAGKVPEILKYSTKGLHAGVTQFDLMAAAFRLMAVQRTSKLVVDDYLKSGRITSEHAASLRAQVERTSLGYWKRAVPFQIAADIITMDGQKEQSALPIGFLGLPTGMFLSFMALFLGFGVVFIIHDSETGLLGRISMVAGEREYLAGNLLAMLLTGVFITLSATLIAQLFFGLEPPCGYVAYATVLFFYGFLLVCSLTLLSLLIGNAAAAYSVSAPLIIFFSFIGGCFFTVDALPEILRYMTFLSPQGLAIQGIAGAAKGEMWKFILSCGVMLGLALPLIGLTMQRLRSHLI
jgi:hypothetical protein